jgi:16S rRNA G1207 methylase RsmC
MYALFVDFRVVFDKVDTEKIFQYMRQTEREESANGWYRRSRRYTQEQKTMWSWERQKVNDLRRQREWDRAARSADVADIDEILKKAQAGESVVGKEKVWRLAFADDLVIVGKNEREMKEMIKNLGKYMRKKKLEVNVEKTKTMVFNKRKRKSEENEWNWEERQIEQVNELKYLHYTLKERREVISGGKWWCLRAW